MNGVRYASPRLESMVYSRSISQSGSIVQDLGNETLKKIATEFVKLVRASTTIDWNLKQTVRAAIRANIRRLLVKYDYPPDLEQRAVELVLQQAELFADASSGSGGGQ